MTGMLLVRGSASHLPLRDESVQTCVTSPPYWGLRQYAGEQREVWGGDSECAHRWTTTTTTTTTTNGTGASTLTGGRESWGDRGGDTVTGFCACGAWYGALGLEPTPELYVEHMVAIFREVRRVLRKDGTLWLNLGDSYAAGKTGRDDSGGNGRFGGPRLEPTARAAPLGMKPKDLCGIPWMVAFALRADGWYLRSDIIWAKPNPMPESVTDRPTKAHEYLFLLSKSQTYYYDADAIREAASENTHSRGDGIGVKNAAIPFGEGIKNNQDYAIAINGPVTHRNKRTVWTIATRPYPGAHFATYPEDLVEPCILAGSSHKACGVCGAPWERETEMVEAAEAFRNSGRYVAQSAVPSNDAHDGGRPKALVRGATTGWAATCAHDDDSGQSVVLDPFNGSGTTGRVAVRHGRSYVGIDISDEYLREQSRKRIDNIQHVMGGL